MFGSSSGGGDYTYTAAVAAGICHGPIAGVAKMWNDKDLVSLSKVRGECTLGTDPQDTWSFLDTQHPNITSLNYNGLAYFRSKRMALDSGASMPNMSFEVFGIGINQTNSNQQAVTSYTSVNNVKNFNGPWDVKTNTGWIPVKSGTIGHYIYTVALAPTGTFQLIQNIIDIAIYFTGVDNLTMTVTIPDGYTTTGTLGLNQKTPIYITEVITITSGESVPYTFTYGPSGTLASGTPYPTFTLVGSSNFNITDIKITTVSSINAGDFLTTYGTLDALPTDIITDLLTNSIYGVYPYFPLGDFEWFKQWCLASNLMLSPVYDECQAGASILNDLMDCLHGEIVWSGGQLKLRSYADSFTESTMGSYTPNITPIYNFTNNNFLAQIGEPPVKCSRINTADAHNDIFIEYYNRANAYNAQTIEVKDQGDITTLVNGLQKGVRPKKMTCHAICDSNIAMTVAQHQLQRECYIRNTYKFTVGYQYVCLEPMDLVTITDINTQLNNIPVLIKTIEENEDGKFDIEAEEYPYGVNSVVQYPVQNPLTKVINYDIPAPPCNTPIFIEPTEQLSDNPNALSLWIAVSGALGYGGCQAWVSTDGNSYSQFALIKYNARQGITTSTLPISEDPDLIDILSVDLGQSVGGLASGTQQDADMFNTICYVGGELISYETATLTGSSTYDLTYLRRGCYGTNVQSIPAGSQFVRLDGAIVKYPFNNSRIGQQLWFKFPSMNIYGGGVQDLSTTTAYTYTLQGTALTTAPADVTGLVYSFSSSVATISWNPIVDTRNVQYQILKGPTLATAIVVGLTNSTNFTTLGNGTYYVRATTTYADSIYPPSIIISGSVITNNIIESFSEGDTNPPWKGQKTDGAVIDQTGRLWLDNTNGIITNPYGTYSSYEQIILPAVQPVQASFTLTAAGDNPSNLVADWSDFASVANVAGNYTGKTNVQVMISVSQDGSSWGAWSPFVPGKYTGIGFKVQLVLTTSNITLTPAVTYFQWSVDVADRIDSSLQNVSCLSGGSTFTWNTPFNIIPNVQVVVLNSESGDYITFTAPTTNVNVYPQVKNAGTGVARNLDVIAAGY